MLVEEVRALLSPGTFAHSQPHSPPGQGGSELDGCPSGVSWSSWSVCTRSLLRGVQLGWGAGGTWGQRTCSDGASSSRRGWFPFSYTRVLDNDGGDRLHMR